MMILQSMCQSRLIYLLKKVTHSGPVIMHNCTETDCTFTCMFPSDLKRHHDKVHKGIRWACELCDFSAGYKGDLNRHIKIVHQVKQIEYLVQVIPWMPIRPLNRRIRIPDSIAYFLHCGFGYQF